MNDFIDDSLVNDFLTESNELIEQLDVDLVRLETETGNTELLDQIFRALHTIKGAASFLNLDAMTSFTHAAEDALNKMRKGEVEVTEHVIDCMLKSVDIIRNQLKEMADGDAITYGPQHLIDALHKIADIKSPQPTASSSDTPDESGSAGAADAVAPGGAQVRSIEFPPQKADVLPFMVDDLLDSAAQLESCIEQLAQGAGAGEISQRVVDLSETMQATAGFFDLEILVSLVKMVRAVGDSLITVDEELIPAIALRVRTIIHLINPYAEMIGECREPVWPLEQFADRLETLLSGKKIEDQASADATTAIEVLEADGVFIPESSSPSSVATDTPVSEAAGPTTPKSDDPKSETPTGTSGAEQTVRVEVKRLESLMNLVGEMVLTKNQIRGLGRTLSDHTLPHEVKEMITSTVSDLDRLTGELQVGVMRTRMQPLDKLFGRYPRIIRDLARSTDKEIDLKIIGGETEVDKSVLELLADPMVHILRNSADHGIEMPADRLASGKPETGTITINAAHQGGHVRVEIVDNGKGLSREKLASLAVKRGITTEAQVASLTDNEVYQFIFAAGFSTATEVSNLSGRGVGMDVVRTNISKLGGEVHVVSTQGEGTTIEITIPLTVAILPAMLVGVGTSEYAIPIANIIEIVKPDESTCYSVAGAAVLRLRETVLPLVDMTDLLGEPRDEQTGQFAVVIESGQQCAGLLVDRLVGQQEVVIKSLDDEYTSGGPFSGATIREDGDVSLILDITALTRSAQVSHDQGAPVPAQTSIAV